MSAPVKKILVPTDFTKVAECALNHAGSLAARMNAEIHVLHIVSDKDYLEEARTRLQMLIDRLKNAGETRPLVPVVRVDRRGPRRRALHPRRAKHRPAPA